MLETLDEISWDELTHAYGPAADVPQHIRDLTSSEKSVRTDAINELFGNIYHQGTIYQATGYAVPFLIELLLIEEIQDKADILGLLISIAGGVYLQIPQVDAKIAISRAFAVYTLFLASQEPNERILATILLSSIAEFQVRAHPLLFQAFEKEEEPTLKTHFLIGAVLTGKEKVSSHQLITIFEASRYSALQLSVACLLLKQDPTLHHPALVHLLINSYAEENEVFEDIGELWSIGDVSLSVYDTLYQLDYRVLVQYYRSLLRLEHRIKTKTDQGRRPYALTDYLCLLVRATFQDRLLLENLDKAQQEVLRKAKVFYAPTGNPQYDFWLDNEFLNFYNTLQADLEISLNKDQLREGIHKISTPSWIARLLRLSF